MIIAAERDDYFPHSYVSDMTDRPRDNKTVFVIASWVCFIAVVGLCLWPFGAIWLATKQSIWDLEREASSMAPVVDSIYDYRAKNGSWPTQLEGVIPKFTRKMTDRGWLYYQLAPPDDVAELTISGGCHTRLRFVFASPNNRNYQAGWHCSMEGDPVAFAVKYQPRK